MFVDIKRHQRRRRSVTLHCFVYLGSSVSLIAYPSHASRLSMQRFWRQILHWIRFHFPFLCCKAFAFKHLYSANSTFLFLEVDRSLFALTFITQIKRFALFTLSLLFFTTSEAYKLFWDWVLSARTPAIVKGNNLLNLVWFKWGSQSWGIRADVSLSIIGREKRSRVLS